MSKSLKLRRLKSKLLFHYLSCFVNHVVKHENDFGMLEHLLILEEYFLDLRDPSFWDRERSCRWETLQKILFLIRQGNWKSIKRFQIYWKCNEHLIPFSEFAYWGWLNSGAKITDLFRLVENRKCKPRPKRFVGVGHNDSRPPPSPLTKGLPSWEEVASSTQVRKISAKQEFEEEFRSRFRELNRTKPFIEILL